MHGMNMRAIYRNLYADIRRKKAYIVFTVALLFLAAALSVFNPPELRKVLLVAVDALRRMAQDYRSKALFYVIVGIFVHNAVALFIGLFSGALLFIIPACMIVANGYLIGFLVIPRLSEIWLLIPHGVFELPAFVLACSYGIWLGLWMLDQNKVETLKFRLRQCIVIYFYVVVPLLFIAATIEGCLFKYALRH
jgi:stage II sporulation protein M